jgi:hypothetical protein
MDGMQQDRLIGLQQKNRRLGIALALLAVGLFVYSFVVIRQRGNIPVPAHLSPLQKIWRGL